MMLLFVVACDPAPGTDGGANDAGTDASAMDAGPRDSGSDGGGSGDASPDAGDDAASDAGPAACVAPTQIVFDIDPEATRLDPGYTGIAHALRVNWHTRFVLDVTDCDDDCERCTVAGPVRGTDPSIGQRCVGDTSIICSNDADCGAGGRCRHMFGAPNGFDVAGSSSCVQLWFEPVSDPEAPEPVRGVIDLRSGALEFERLNFAVAIALTECPRCAGDASPVDGVASGACTGTSVHEGAACDVTGRSPTTSAHTSFDCPPGLAEDIRLEIGVPVGVASTRGTVWTLDASRPLCTDTMVPAGSRCWCGVCAADARRGCGSNADCGATGGACIGTMRTGGIVGDGTAPNYCEAGSDCVYDPATATSSCMNWVTGTTASCFPSEPDADLLTPGATRRFGDVFFPRVAGIACLPPTGDDVSDSVAGLPGPVRFDFSFRAEPVYPGDH